MIGTRKDGAREDHTLRRPRKQRLECPRQLSHFALLGDGPAEECGLLPTKKVGAKHGSSQLSKNVGHGNVPLNTTQAQDRVEGAQRVKTLY